MADVVTGETSRGPRLTPEARAKWMFGALLALVGGELFAIVGML
jgi:hypothetical protein